MRQTILRWQRKPLGEKAFIILNGLFLLIICAIILYPIIYQVYNSVFLYSAEDIRFKDISECKRKFSLRRWHEILSKEQYGTEIFTLFARTIIGTVLSLCLTTFLAFVLSRREIRWRHIMSLFWVITFYIEPGIVPKVIYYKKSVSHHPSGFM